MKNLPLSSKSTCELCYFGYFTLWMYFCQLCASEISVKAV